MRKILVTGGNGQVGTELQRCIWPADVQLAALDRNDLDLTDTSAIAGLILKKGWSAVINAGAYTAVDKAEDDVVTAWAVNALAPAAIAAACTEADIPLVHISTDYVFGGAKVGAWEVTDKPDPLCVYGASKLGGELAVSTSDARHAIIRTAWVVSAQGANFVKTMLRIAAAQPELRVVADQHGSPTSAADLANAICKIVLRLMEDEDAPTGILHFSNSGATNWADFAREIFRQSAMRGGVTAVVRNIATSDYPTPAKRPANSVLSHQAIKEKYGINPRAWETAVGEILDELVGAANVI